MTQLLTEVDYDDEEFVNFTHRKFHDNCAEREAYGEGLYSYEEYLEKNRNFLLEAFKHKGK